MTLMPETPRWQDSRWVWLLCLSFSSLTLLFLAFCLYLPIYRSTTLLIPFLSKTRSRRKQNTYINFTVLIFLDFLESFFCCKEKESSAEIDINFTVFDWRFSTFVFGGRKKRKKNRLLFILPSVFSVPCLQERKTALHTPFLRYAAFSHVYYEG